MARSLTVKHEETAATSPLLTAFLFLAFGWMLASALTSAAAESGPMGAIAVDE